jgi:CSLREA domain-containing protein
MRMLKALPLALVMLSAAAPAQAATFDVNSLADGPDANPGNGVCATSGGDCTLRAAVEESASTAPADDIVLGPGVHQLSAFLWVMTNDVAIRGAGARATTIAGSGSDSVLVVTNSTTQIRDLRITGGSSGFGGAGLSVSGAAPVLVERVAITGNHVVSNGNSGSGAGISKDGPGPLTIRSSTVHANGVTTTNPTNTYSAFGGGIAHLDGTLTVVNTTIEGNTATGITAAGSYGGGFYTQAPATLRNVTLARNSVAGPDAHGGNVSSNFAGQLILENSILTHGTAATSGANCFVDPTAALLTAGRNIDSGSSCAFGGPHLSNTDPLLGGLADNGGPTDTLHPGAASPAIDAAIGCPAPPEDQRGVTRPVGVACDIGAVEWAPPTVGPGEPPTPPIPDRVPPIVSDFVISARRFRIGRATRRTRSLPRATNFVFHLSERSLVKFAFERRAAGRRARSGSCQRPSRRNRGGRRCMRWLRAGSLADNLPDGTQSVRFDGDVTVGGRGRTLRAGSYRVRVVATDGAGNRSAPVSGRFKIVR